MYVSGSLYGQEMDWLVDTGCDVTLLPSKIYFGILPHRRPELLPCDQDLAQADGTPLVLAGMARMTFYLCGQKFNHTVIVGDCGTAGEGLRGVDLRSERLRFPPAGF